MTTDELAIYPYLAIVIHRAKVQKYTLASPVFGNLKVAVIPNSGNKVGMTNAGEFALWTEGNHDLRMDSHAILSLYQRGQNQMQNPRRH